MKKKTEERTIDNQPDVVFFEASRMIPVDMDGHCVSTIPVNLEINPSFGEVDFLPADEKDVPKVFHVDDKDIEYLDYECKL